MRYFEDQEELEEWLKSLGYDAFWQKIAGFDLELQSKESCDAQIASGSIDEETVLEVVKAFARLQIIRSQNLAVRDTVPWMSMH